MIRTILLGVLIVSLSACAGAGFKIDKQEYRQKVRTLGVVPLLVDGNSRLEHPRAAEVVDLLQRSSAGQHQHLVELLKQQKGYFDVRPVTGNAKALFGPVLLEMRVPAPMKLLRPISSPWAIVAFMPMKVFSPTVTSPPMATFEDIHTLSPITDRSPT